MTRTPEKGLGRASDGRFILSTIEIRNTTFSESQEPPLVYVSLAEADINQKLKEDPVAYDMMPGTIESAIVIEPVGGGGASGGRRFGGWSIVDDERKKPHEAIFLPLEPLATNEASVHSLLAAPDSAFKFKSLIGRFRISYTEDDRIRELMLPAHAKLWSSIGPFPAQDVTKAYATAFEPEKDIKNEPLDLKKSYTKIVLPPASKEGAEKKVPAATPAKSTGDKNRYQKRRPGTCKDAARQAGARKVGAAAPASPESGKPAATKSAGEVREEAGGATAGEAPKPDQHGKPGPKGAKRARATPSGLRQSLVPKRQKRPRPRQSRKTRRPRARRGRRPHAAKPQAGENHLDRATQSGATALLHALQGANSAYYLTRKIESTRTRALRSCRLTDRQASGCGSTANWHRPRFRRRPRHPPRKRTPSQPARETARTRRTTKMPKTTKDEPVIPEINDTSL